MNHEITSIKTRNNKSEILSLNWSNIRWGLVGLGVVIAFAIAYGSSIIVVTGYATYLSVLARGAPDMVLINDFAARTAGGVTSVFLGVGTLVGGLRTGRKAKKDAFHNGLLVGLITAFIDLGISLLGGVSPLAAVSVAFALGGGWLAGKRAESTLSSRH